MSYISKKTNTASICEDLHLGYIKTKDGKTTNPYLWLHADLDLATNKVINVRYDVTAFDNKNTIGYHRSTHKTYDEAKEVYDSLFKHHVE